MLAKDGGSDVGGEEADGPHDDSEDWRVEEEEEEEDQEEEEEEEEEEEKEEEEEEEEGEEEEEEEHEDSKRQCASESVKRAVASAGVADVSTAITDWAAAADAAAAWGGAGAVDDSEDANGDSEEALVVFDEQDPLVCAAREGTDAKQADSADVEVEATEALHSGSKLSIEDVAEAGVDLGHVRSRVKQWRVKQGGKVKLRNRVKAKSRQLRKTEATNNF